MRTRWKRQERSPRTRKSNRSPASGQGRLLVVGLGNPGSGYTSTRHNVGFRVVEALARDAGARLRRRGVGRYAVARIAVGGGSVFLAEPLTMMNRSGDVMAALLQFSGCALQQLVVICDSIDLPVGAVRLKRSGSAGGHNGLASIIAAVGGEFPRRWVGVGRPDDGTDVTRHVLGTPGSDDRQRIEASERFSGEHVVRLVGEPIDRVMHVVNSYDSG